MQGENLKLIIINNNNYNLIQTQQLKDLLQGLQKNMNGIRKGTKENITQEK